MATKKETHTPDVVRRHLERFRASISQTRENYPCLRAFGQHYAAAPYVERAAVCSILDSPETSPVLREEFCDTFRLLERDIATLEQELGRPYRDLLKSDLLRYMDVYAASVFHAHAGNAGDDDRSVQSLREVIGILLAELERDCDLSGQYHLVHALDARHPCLPEEGEAGSPALPAAATGDCRSTVQGRELPAGP